VCFPPFSSLCRMFWYPRTPQQRAAVARLRHRLRCCSGGRITCCAPMASAPAPRDATGSDPVCAILLILLRRCRPCGGPPGLVQPPRCWGCPGRGRRPGAQSSSRPAPSRRRLRSTVWRAGISVTVRSRFRTSCVSSSGGGGGGAEHYCQFFLEISAIRW
jgi:hypothetical protein